MWPKPHSVSPSRRLDPGPTSSIGCGIGSRPVTTPAARMAVDSPTERTTSPTTLGISIIAALACPIAEPLACTNPASPTTPTRAMLHRGQNRGVRPGSPLRRPKRGAGRRGNPIPASRRDADQTNAACRTGTSAQRPAPAVQFPTMRKASTKTVVGISLGADDQDFAFDARLLRQRLNVRRLGTNGSTAKALKLLKHWGQIGRCDRHRRRQGQLHGRIDPLRREGQRPPEERGHACAGHDRRAPVGHPAGMGAAPRAGQARRLLQQRQGAVLLGPDELQARAGDVGVHGQPRVRRPAAATRRAEAPRRRSTRWSSTRAARTTCSTGRRTA